MISKQIHRCIFLAPITETWHEMQKSCWVQPHALNRISPVYAGLCVSNFVEAGNLEAVGVSSLAFVHKVPEGQHHLQDLSQPLAPNHLLGSVQERCRMRSIRGHSCRDHMLHADWYMCTVCRGHITFYITQSGFTRFLLFHSAWHRCKAEGWLYMT